jgi:hypothetical protein
MTTHLALSHHRLCSQLREASSLQLNSGNYVRSTKTALGRQEKRHSAGSLGRPSITFP